MNEDWFEKTAQYLNDEMSTEERLLFESEMKANEELSSLFNTYKAIENEMCNIEKNHEQEALLKGSLKKLNAVYFQKEIKDDSNTSNFKEEPPASDSLKALHQETHKPKKIKIWKALSIAAATTGIIALAVLYLQEKKENPQVAVNTKKTDTAANNIKPDTDHLQKNITSSNLAQNNTASNAAEIKQPHTFTKKKQEELFADNFKPDKVPDNTEGALEDAFDYYNNHDYADAAAEFSSANLNSATRGLETDPKLTAFYADYYAGLSYLAKGQAANAISKLKNALNKSPGDLFKIKAEWYLSLAYLKTGDIKKTSELLTIISANNREAEYKLKAGKLLDELK